MWTVLKYYRILDTILYRKINFNRQPEFSYFLFVNELYNFLNCKKHISDMPRTLSVIYIWGLLTRTKRTKSSILTIKYVFSFFWSLNCKSLVCKLYISIRFILDFWAVLILDVYSYLHILKDKINSWSFFRCFLGPYFVQVGPIYNKII